MEIVELFIIVVLAIATTYFYVENKFLKKEPKQEIKPEEPKKTKEQMRQEKEDKKRAKEVKEAFDNLMKYDYETALQKKR